MKGVGGPVPPATREASRHPSKETHAADEPPPWRRARTSRQQIPHRRAAAGETLPSQTPEPPSGGGGGGGSSHLCPRRKPPVGLVLLLLGFFFHFCWVFFLSAFVSSPLPRHHLHRSRSFWGNFQAPIHPVWRPHSFQCSCSLSGVMPEKFLHCRAHRAVLSNHCGAAHYCTMTQCQLCPEKLSNFT